MHLTRRTLGRLALAIGARSTGLLGANGIDAALRVRVDTGKIPAVAAVAGTDAATTYSGAFGKRDSGSNVPMAVDSIFRIASMTKAVTSVAAMQMVEQGKVNLDEPASRLVPELGRLQVLDGFASGKPILRAATKPVTLRQLLTHTSGFVYDLWDVNLQRFDASGRDDKYVLSFEPGTKWQYGQGPMWAGRMVEAASSLTLEQYFQKNIFGPLNMKDTTFVFPQEKFERLAGTYQRQPNGSLTPVKRMMPKPPRTFEGDGGLFSTAPDYLKFCQMILRRGAAPSGARILQAKTVAQMSENGTGNLPAGRLRTTNPAQSSDVDFHPGHDDRYTLGFLMNPDPYPGRRSAGSLAWAGISNTYYWIDPKRAVCGVVMMQFLPFADREAVALFADFEQAVYGAHP